MCVVSSFWLPTIKLLWTYTCKAWLDTGFRLSGWIPRSEMSGPHGKSMFNFTNCPPPWPHHLTPHQRCVSTPTAPHPHPNSVLPDSLDMLVAAECYLTVALICISWWLMKVNIFSSVYYILFTFINETGMILYKLFCRHLIRMEAASKLLGSPGLGVGVCGPAGKPHFRQAVYSFQSGPYSASDSFEYLSLGSLTSVSSFFLTPTSQ